MGRDTPPPGPFDVPGGRNGIASVGSPLESDAAGPLSLGSRVFFFLLVLDAAVMDRRCQSFLGSTSVTCRSARASRPCGPPLVGKFAEAGGGSEGLGDGTSSTRMGVEGQDGVFNKGEEGGRNA